MIKYHLVLVLIIIVSSCAQLRINSGEPLRERFNAYRQFVNAIDKTHNTEKQFFTAGLWSTIQRTRKQTEKEKGLFGQVIMGFPNDIKTITNSKEVVNANKGCLYVEGLGAKSEPVVYYVSAVKNKSNWVFDKFETNYFTDGIQPIIKKPICNEEERNSIWMEYMQRL